MRQIQALFGLLGHSLFVFPDQELLEVDFPKSQLVTFFIDTEFHTSPRQ